MGNGHFTHLALRFAFDDSGSKGDVVPGGPRSFGSHVDVTVLVDVGPSTMLVAFTARAICPLFKAIDAEKRVGVGPNVSPAHSQFKDCGPGFL
jgi:hypothetical protein